MPDLVRLATAGSVDDGKSTLIGRLLYDSKALMADQLDDAEVDLSRLTDGLRAEREQGITIDVAYRFFATPRRSFIIADTPGHVRYTRNMVTGASTADVAVVLIDARNGVLEQSRRHAYLSALLGIRHLVAVVNKMDLVDWDEDALPRDRARLRGACSSGSGCPTAARSRSRRCTATTWSSARRRAPWYDGPAAARAARDARGRQRPQPRRHRGSPSSGWCARTDYRGYAGQVASGVLRPGDEVVVLPGGERTRIERIETFDGPLEAAFPPLSVTVLLADDIDAGRGSMLAAAADPPPAARRLEARLCWMTDAPASDGRALRAQAHDAPRAGADRVARRAARRRRAATTSRARRSSALNDIGRVHLDLAAPVMAEPYERNRVTGAFILVDEATNATVGRRHGASPRTRTRARPAARTAPTWSGTSRRCRGASAGRSSGCAARPCG